ncbi:Pentatricopeptide repeat-containing protein, mitochondrial [Glycine soja]|uniref:Pentatricopeptide repeat-containing protein, mitochondrial n=1 Tax=Glycine soja TaxID=3848 RepID=A0A445IBX8_GLYSO|nr:Pentatricopeptide repeat-containing protein, mitochondrial [Glycine soja]
MMLIRSKCKLVKMCGVSVCGSLGMCMYSTESVVASLENGVFKNGDPLSSVSPILNQWVEEGREVTKLQLEDLAYRLTQSRRFTHALQDLHPVNITPCCNMMLELYAKKGKYEKLDRLMQEMKEKDICNASTYTIRLNAYVVVTDIKGMEKLLMQMEADPVATVDWYTYMTAANGYRRVHNFEKVAEMLKKSEHLARGNTRRLAFESIQTMYAIIGNKDEVYRLWNMCTSLKKPNNSSYIRMLSSLAKLDEIDGAEKILEEWESKYANFDVRIPHLMISAYCKWGQFDKAEAYIRRLLDGGKQLDGRTWDRLACGYKAGNDMEKAVQAMKKAVSKNLGGRRPDPFTLVACVKYLKEKGDLDLALEILKLCIENSHISVTSYGGLSSYVHSETQGGKNCIICKGFVKLFPGK